MKSRLLSVRDYIQYHPKELLFDTDAYYASLANRFQAILLKTIDKRLFPADLVRELSLRLTAHFEDVVSDLGIWRSFCWRHKKRYGSYLPFDLADDGFPLDELTRGGIHFVVWTVFVDHPDRRLASPLMPAMAGVAQLAYDFYQKEFYDAPINESLASLIYDDKTLRDFYGVRRILEWLSHNTYLSRWHETEISYWKWYETLGEILPGLKDDEHKWHYAVDSVFPFVEKAGPLSLFPQQWYADMLHTCPSREFGVWENNLEEIEFQRLNTLKILGAQGGQLLLKNVRGEMLSVELDSFGGGLGNAFETNNIIVGSLAKFAGKWNMVGCSAFANSDTYFEERVLQRKKKHEEYQRTIDLYESAIKKSRGRRLFYFENFESFKNWLKDVVGMRGVDAATSGFHQDIKTGKQFMVYIPYDGDLEFAFGCSANISDSENPYYDSSEARESAISMIDAYGTISTEWMYYLIENGFLKDAAFPGPNEEASRYLLQSNLPFVCTFMRRCNVISPLDD